MMDAGHRGDCYILQAIISCVLTKILRVSKYYTIKSIHYTVNIIHVSSVVVNSILCIVYIL